MAQVGSYEAKTHLPRLLERVAKGERVTITRHGVPVAQLVPVAPTTGEDAAQTIESIRRFRHGRRLGGLSLKRMIEEGRR